MFKWLKSGSPWIWLTGGAVSISLLSVLGLLLLIGWKGLSYFWPAPLYQWQTKEGEILVGQIYSQEYVPITHLREMDIDLPDSVKEKGLAKRVNIKLANRDLYSADFVSLLEIDLNPPTKPQHLAVIERTRGGDFFGQPVGYQHSDGRISNDVTKDITSGLAYAQILRKEIERLIQQEVRVISAQAERLRLEKRKRSLNDNLDDEFVARYEAKNAEYLAALAKVEAKLDNLRSKLEQQGL